MERSIDISALSSLPLDAGLLAARRPAPATNEDSELFRQHLDMPHPGAETSQRESPVEEKHLSRRERTGSRSGVAKRGTQAERGSDAKRGTDTKRGLEGRRAAKSEKPASDNSCAPERSEPLDDAKPVSPEGDEVAAEATEVDSAEEALASDSGTPDSESDGEAIVAEVTAIIAAAPVVPVALEPTLPPVAEVPVVEPIDAVPAAKAPHGDSLPVPAPVVAEQVSQPVAAKSADEVVADAVATPVVAEEAEQPEARPEKPAEVKVAVEREGAPVEAPEQAEQGESKETKKAAEPEGVVAPENSELPETEANSKDDDAGDERPRKGVGAKAHAQPADATPAANDSSAASKPAPAPATLHPAATAIAPPVAVAAAAEKIASNGGQSAAPRGVGHVESATPHRLPQHLAAKPGEPAGNEIKLSDVEQVRLLQRVARAFQTAQQREGEVRIRLSPPELGSLKLEIKVEDGVMTARAETESQATQQILIDSLPALRERLAEQNIRLEQFDVNLPGRQSPGQESRDSQPGGSGGRGGLGGNDREANAAAEQPAAVRHHDGKLNVFI